MKQDKTDIFYSEPVTEIMGSPPPGLVRSGTIVIFILFVLFVLFTWFIKYPDVIPSPVEITTTNPPVTLVSKITGHIKYLYVEDREKVSKNQIIGIMETTASIREIDSLISLLDKMTSAGTELLPDFSNLGELQEPFAEYRKNHKNLISYDNNDIYGSKISAAKLEISGLNDYIERLKGKEKLYEEYQKIEEKKYKRDEGLFKDKYIAESQLEETHQVLLKNKIELQQVRLDLSAKQIELIEKEQLLQNYMISKIEDRESLLSTLEQSFLNLKAGLDIWKNTFFLVSPVEGTATFTKYWSTNQSVVKDEPVVSIVPENAGEIVGRVNLRMQRSGKVKENQQVNIKLSGFPYLEFGMIRGRVKSKSLVPSGDSYIIEIDLPQGLTTQYGKSVEFTQNMQGTAEIITDDMRLIQKIVYPIRYMMMKNRGKDYFPE
ncbi:MAG TPA: hypothetical protein VHO46_13490 [Bacteroidales bacterium]|nr:hypothetical protein [Bacteroidales bacterium]